MQNIFKIASVWDCPNCVDLQQAAFYKCEENKHISYWTSVRMDYGMVSCILYVLWQIVGWNAQHRTNK